MVRGPIFGVVRGFGSAWLEDSGRPQRANCSRHLTVAGLGAIIERVPKHEQKRLLIGHRQMGDGGREFAERSGDAVTWGATCGYVKGGSR